MGNVFQAGLGQCPARRSAAKAGVPFNRPAVTINKVCGSGLAAVNLAAQAIRLGERKIVVAAGTENMSLAPFILKKARWGYKMGNDVLVDSMLEDGLWDSFNHYHMGMTAENVARRYNITRQEQDLFACESQIKTKEAVKQGKFREEILPLEVPQHKGKPVIFSEDEFPKPETTPEKLAQLSPAFQKDGTVTAGNSSGINDGAAALLIMEKEKAKSLNLKSLAGIKGCAAVGLDPEFMGMGPVPATKEVLRKTGLELEQIDLIEVNEAFAGTSIAVIKELGLDKQKVNVNGGAIALGHPIGASGARILVTLLFEMQRRKVKYGLAALCIGGGQGMAMILERE
jgi:acetyl-CoA C-acetyltransferase